MSRHIGYCLKEKQKMEIMNPEVVQTKNGRYIIRGTCQNGHKIQKFLSTKEGSGLLGSLFGVKIPVLGDLPILNTIF